ncbi:MAG: dihydroorotase [Oscillospiraceae bacterium]|jgi:dihydroorotase|nr:dihydroorotase [Oscillospiraceae bacterium]
MEILIKDGLVFNGEGFLKQDVLCEGGIIKEVGVGIKKKTEYVINAENLIVSPGFVDLHVHLRQPGFEQKETISSGTAAAVAGGFTTICAMPNLNPTPDCKKNLEIEKKIIKEDAKCRVLPFMSITLNREGKKVVTPVNGCVGISDDGNSVQDEKIMKMAMKVASEKNVLLSAHCEDKNFTPENWCVNKGEYSKRTGLKAVSNASEYEELKRDLYLLKKNKCKYHVCHVSTKESVELIREAKRQNLSATCEVTPHHLILCEDDLKDDGCFKMSPPLRTKKDKEALINAITDGTIDAIATDHAPHTENEKSKGLKGSAMGVVGLECAFSVLYESLVTTCKLSIDKLLNLMSFYPAKIININCGIKPFFNADMVIIDLKKSLIVDPDKFFSKGRSTPFKDKKVKGKIVATIFDGRVVYKNF